LLNFNKIKIILLALYDELKQMKEACGTKVHMKSILAVGELGSLENIYKASFVAMMVLKKLILFLRH